DPENGMQAGRVHELHSSQIDDDHVHVRLSLISDHPIQCRAGDEIELAAQDDRERATAGVRMYGEVALHTPVRPSPTLVAGLGSHGGCNGPGHDPRTRIAVVSSYKLAHPPHGAV